MGRNCDVRWGNRCNREHSYKTCFPTLNQRVLLLKPRMNEFAHTPGGNTRVVVKRSTW